MTKNLDAVSVEVLQQRLAEELDAQRRLQEELQTALESERNLRLENDLLWAYMERKYPERIKEAEGLLQRLTEGSDLSIELKNRAHKTPAKNKTFRQRVRHKVGTLPGVPRVYHGLKNLRK